MGVIIRQSLKRTIVVVLATLVAAVAHLFVYTSDESVTYDSVQRILAIVLLLYPIIQFGLPQALIKFANSFRTQGQSYLLHYLILAFASFGLFVGLYLVFQESILGAFDLLGMNSDLLVQYGPMMALLIIILMVTGIFKAYLSDHHRIVVPAIFDNLWPKIALGVLVFLKISGTISTETLFYGVVLYFGLALVGMIVYTLLLGKLDLRWNGQFFKKPSMTPIVNYAGYTGLAVFGSTLATRVDAAMVTMMTEGQMTGVYALFLFMASVIDLPARSMTQISGPILSKAHDEKDMDTVSRIFSKGTRAMLTIGVAIFGLIAVSIGDLFLMNGKFDFYSPFFMVFGVLACAKLLATTFSSCAGIILYSKWFRATLYLTLLLGVSNLILNYYFLSTVFSDRPLIGVALSTALSLAVYYILMLLFIRVKFGIHPFSWKLCIPILAALLIGLGFSYLPNIGVPFIDIVWQSLLFGSLYVAIVYYFEVSSDINALIDQLLERIKNRDFKNLI